MKILLYGINYAPELTGIGKYTGEMAAWLAGRGHEVRVVTAPPYYPDWKVGAGYTAGRYVVEQREGVKIWRTPLWVPFRHGGVKRLLHLASFAVSSMPVLFRQLFWHPQLVWVVAPAFFCVPGAWLTARLCGARCWLHIQDFEVDAAFELGLMRGAKLRALALGLERWLLRRFDRVSSISLRMLDHLLSKGVARDRVVPFPNWVDLDAIRPAASRVGAGGTAMAPANRYRAELQIAPDAVVALYSGNMGKKQGLEILAKAAELTRSRVDLVWVFCGEGVGRGDFERACVGLPNVRLLPLQPVGRLSELLNLADIHLLPQRADVEDLVMPSKLSGMLASGRPVVATARAGTELEKVVAGCGVVVDAENPEAFGRAVIALADDAERRTVLGLAARAYAEAYMGRDAVLGAFETALLHLVTDDASVLDERPDQRVSK
jgi:colanic acid biosynthesis glycosyl transferase WcaI